MKLLATGDIHARNKPDGALYNYRRLVRAITLQAKYEGCSFVIHAGDLIHEKHATLVELLIMLRDEFVYARKQGITWVLMPGNHDMPAKHKPALTILQLFKGVATVYVNRAVLKAQGWSLYLNPWRLPDEFKKNCKALAQACREDANPFKIQFAHIGLAEGVLSPSNTYRAPSAVRVADLYPGLYQMTLCADYHTTQQLHDKVWYMGAPIAHQHGDATDQGVWVIDTTARSVRQVDIPGKWPKFITRNLAGKEVLDINPKDNYKLRVTSDMHPYYQLQVAGKPNVKLEVVSDFQQMPTARRLEGVNEGDSRHVLQIWLKKKGYLDPEYAEMGDLYLSRAEKWLYEHRA